MKTKTKPNIILILIDALRADYLGSYGFSKPISPAIDSLAKQGVLFENCFTCTNASDPALTSIMTGMYPRTHGIVHHSFEVSNTELKTFDTRNVQLLQQVFKQNNYHTFGLDFLARWHARGYDFYPELKIDRTKRKRQLFLISKTFQLLHIKPLFKKLYAAKAFKKVMGGFDSYPKDTETTQKALELMSQHKKPYFLFIHYWGVHKPYTCPAIDNKLSTACYEDAIKTVDAHVQKIMNAAEKNDIIVLLGDHGESLGEHSIAYDHHGLYEPSLKVPLIIKGGSLPKGKRINALTSTIDVFSTILNLAGITYTAKIDGIDLALLIKETTTGRPFIIAEENYYQQKACIRTQKFKLIKAIGNFLCGKCNIVHGAEIELYNLEEDPQEEHNLAQEQKEIVEKLTKQLEMFIPLKQR